MGIFNHHHATQSNLGAGVHAAGQDNEKESSSSNSTTSSTHSGTSSAKSSCGCGCAHKTKPMDEEVVEIKEEWDY